MHIFYYFCCLVVDSLVEAALQNVGQKKSTSDSGEEIDFGTLFWIYIAPEDYVHLTSVESGQFYF